MATIQSDKLIRNKLSDGRQSLTVGDMGTLKFVCYELLTMLVMPMPGGLGFLLRKKLYRYFLGRIGSGAIIGRNVTIRHPNKVFLGDNVTIDDGCIVDGRGSDDGVVLDDGVMINRNCMVLAKNGSPWQVWRLGHQSCLQVGAISAPAHIASMVPTVR